MIPVIVVVTMIKLITNWKIGSLKWKRKDEKKKWAPVFRINALWCFWLFVNLQSARRQADAPIDKGETKKQRQAVPRIDKEETKKKRQADGPIDKEETKKQRQADAPIDKTETKKRRQADAPNDKGETKKQQADAPIDKAETKKQRSEFTDVQREVVRVARKARKVNCVNFFVLWYFLYESY